jgi:hypothetical protein
MGTERSNRMIAILAYVSVQIDEVLFAWLWYTLRRILVELIKLKSTKLAILQDPDFCLLSYQSRFRKPLLF